MPAPSAQFYKGHPTVDPAESDDLDGVPPDIHSPLVARPNSTTSARAANMRRHGSRCQWLSEAWAALRKAAKADPLLSVGLAIFIVLNTVTKGVLTLMEVVITPLFQVRKRMSTTTLFKGLPYIHSRRLRFMTLMVIFLPTQPSKIQTTVLTIVVPAWPYLIILQMVYDFRGHRADNLCTAYGTSPAVGSQRYGTLDGGAPRNRR